MGPTLPEPDVVACYVLVDDVLTDLGRLAFEGDPGARGVGDPGVVHDDTGGVHEDQVRGVPLAPGRSALAAAVLDLESFEGERSAEQGSLADAVEAD